MGICDECKRQVLELLAQEYSINESVLAMSTIANTEERNVIARNFINAQQTQIKTIQEKVREL